MSENKKILITSALPYVNNVPHLGNLIGCVLSADVFARFCRSSGKETLFICGSDEHGTATENKAKEEGVTPKELCDKYYAIHKDIYEWFDISFDIFGRTSEENHKKITRELFNKVLENGFVSEDTITQPFCTTCNSFLADRFVEGTCPHCGYEDARGDQCDSCGKLLNADELKNPRCKADGTTPEFRQTKHLFLELDSLQPVLEDWVKQQSLAGSWTENAIRTTNSWFKEGLKKRAITRDLKWGINIPESAFDGAYADKVFYVWFDAPIGYISITEQLLQENYVDWWKDSKNTKLYQFMGKDNIPFHTIIFPATLLASQIKKGTTDVPDMTDYTLVHHLNATEYLNYEHGKFSKSRQQGVFGDNAKDSGIPSDVFRYMLLFNRPEHADSQFTWKGMQERLNNELVANFGNFVNRTLTFTKRFFDGHIPTEIKEDVDSQAEVFLARFGEEVAEYLERLEKVELRDALMQFMKISSLCNHFFQESAPWKTRTEYPQKAAQDMRILANVVKDLAILAEPYLPGVSKEIFAQLDLPVQKITDLPLKGVVYTPNVADHTIGEPKVLFKKLEDGEVKALKEKYAGTDEGKVEHKKAEQKKEQPNKQKSEGTKMSITENDVLLQVGKIIDVKKHPDAEKLYIETVDLGEKQIQIVSGLVPYYEVEELQGKQIIVVANLKPAKLRGEKSEGMLLAAENDEGIVGVIEAPEAALGSRVQTSDLEAPKEIITFPEFDQVTLDVKDGVVRCNEKELFADGKTLKADRVKNGSVS